MNLLEFCQQKGLDSSLSSSLADFVSDNYVPAERHNKLQEKHNALKGEYNREKTETTQKHDAYERLSAENKSLKQQLKASSIDHAVDLHLVQSGAKNVRVVKKCLDLSQIKYDDAGQIVGIDEQIAELMKSDSYLFAEESLAAGGANPAHEYTDDPSAASHTPQMKGLTPAPAPAEVAPMASQSIPLEVALRAMMGK